MKVVTIGGGPGGLYASLLLKKAHPDWEVVVRERNPLGVTYGWGIVFPNRTLSDLQEADPETHAEITDAFHRWEPFDVWIDGERYRCGGHAFASMMRTDLLGILQDRCRELGVDLRFEAEVDDPGPLAAEADLLVGADGIHSRTRERYAGDFGTELVEGSARFSWFGTEADFDALSHVFVENDDGIWCAHTYPGRTSTFIVDCDEETWERSGLADASESEYLAYLEDVFADALDGHGLLSEQDRWRRFTTVRNRTWHSDNVVLLGDAAHTAHYSIGSGTTLAMEDGIGIAEAFSARDDVAEALAAYEADRKPFVERLQRAGERSRIHFENIRRYYDLEPEQFTVHHLTRSGRLTYGSLERRDPAFLRGFDRWFAARTPVGPAEPAAVSDPASPLYQPLELGGLGLRNRAVSACEPTFSAVEGRPTAAQRRYLEARASDGAGLVLTEPLAVAPDGRAARGSPGLYEPEHRDLWGRVVERVHDRTDAKVGAVLTHAGRRAGVRPRGLALDRPTPDPDAAAPPAPSPIPYGRGPTPREMDGDDVARVRERFERAAELAGAAGFDLLMLQAGSGHLLSQFLSPLSNDRDDGYGGPLANRMRFPRAVFDDVRGAWPDGPIGVVLHATDLVEGGFGTADAVEVAREFAPDCDLFAPVAGGLTPEETPDELGGPGQYSDDLRNELGVRTLATAYAATEDEATTVVATGRADLCTYYGELER